MPVLIEGWFGQVVFGFFVHLGWRLLAVLWDLLASVITRGSSKT